MNTFAGHAWLSPGQRNVTLFLIGLERAKLVKGQYYQSNERSGVPWNSRRINAAKQVSKGLVLAVDATLRLRSHVEQGY